MREIKFRAWDKTTQKNWNIENWHFEDEYLDLIEPGVSIADPNSKRVWRKFNEIELMQYTGLDDALGHQIYEGDILQDPDDGRFCYEVEYDYGRFSCGDNDLIDCLGCEVIGNKFDNPELLEGTE